VKAEPSEGSSFFRDCLIEWRVCISLSYPRNQMSVIVVIEIQPVSDFMLMFVFCFSCFFFFFFFFFFFLIFIFLYSECC
jgi:hypothetical protein